MDTPCAERSESYIPNAIVGYGYTEMAMQEMDEQGFGSDTPSGARRVSGVSSSRRVDRQTGRAGFGAQFRLRFSRSVMPRTQKGRIAGAVALFASLGLLAGAGYEGQHFLLHDERFVVPGSSAIQIEGNSHLTRAQLLSVFGEDVDRNIFTVSLAQRRTELERLPWVEHATVMRLLPDRLRVSIVERTPVAFVRQGSKIGLVDRTGVLLDMDDDSETASKGAPVQYSFPVVTGVSEDDPASVRSARMKIYLKFASDLDSSKENISSKLSEVDLSNPEDVKALIPDHGTEILVHFGDSDYLDRYRKFEAQLPQWHTQYPKLASADMRYDRQVVLEMQAGASVPTNNTQTAEASDPTPAPIKHAAPRPAAKKTAAPERGRPHTKLAAMGQPHFPDESAPTGKHVISSKPARQ
ncbi:cell division protein FtsQ [Granulicella pectinivorans]|uniref:Cell division protein FtsQ n=2 Tax=Granulicella pectinivorans TaxID=474950 RepID=A0A1I6MHM4_9BACT|nr:cell division protein FtsQ [Granulicella pectinivorans]